jgi:hypothetical protein
MPRHPEPQELADRIALIKKGPPRYCHTCDHYTPNGFCDIAGQEPPEEFARTPDACDDYFELIPF